MKIIYIKIASTQNNTNVIYVGHKINKFKM